MSRNLYTSREFIKRELELESKLVQLQKGIATGNCLQLKVQEKEQIYSKYCCFK